MPGWPLALLVLRIYVLILSFQVDCNVSIPEFCFPDAEEFDVKTASPAAPRFVIMPPLKKEGHIARTCRSVCRYPLTLCN